MTPGQDADSSDAPRVSVILPVYQRLDTLPAALASIDRQTFVDYELIIYDDGSDPPLAERIQALAPRARCFRSERNTGPAAARNAAIKHARGQYLAFIDSDDLWAPETLARHVQALDDNPEAVLSFVDCRRIGLQNAARKLLPLTEAEQRKRLAVSNFIYTLSQVAVRKKTFAAVGGFDEALRNCEDQKFYAQCLEHGRLHHVDYPGTIKRLTDDSISRDLDIRFESIDRYTRWAAGTLTDRSQASLYTAAACVALKTMAPTTSRGWWRHWARTTRRHPIVSLTHGGWYFALAVKAYHYLCRRSLLFKRAEIARAPHPPQVLILHLTDAAGSTQLLESFLRHAARQRPEFLAAVIPLTSDSQTIAAYENLGLGVYSATWLTIGRYPGPDTPLLVVREHEAAENPRVDRITERARFGGADVIQVPEEGADPRELIPKPTAPVPDDASATTLPPELAEPSPAAAAVFDDVLRATRPRFPGGM